MAARAAAAAVAAVSGGAFAKENGVRNCFVWQHNDRASKPLSLSLSLSLSLCSGHQRLPPPDGLTLGQMQKVRPLKLAVLANLGLAVLRCNYQVNLAIKIKSFCARPIKNSQPPIRLT